MHLVRLIDYPDHQGIDEYVRSHPFGRYSDTQSWHQTISSSFGLSVDGFVALEGSAVVGVGQFVLNRGLSLAIHGTSAPLSSSGGGLLYDTEEIGQTILANCTELVRRERWSAIVFRVSYPMSFAPALEGGEYVTFSFDLRPSYDSIWNNVYRDKTRNQIRKAQKSNFKIVYEDVMSRECYAVLCEGLKELGSPCPPRRLFKEFSDRFGELVQFVSTFQEGRRVGVAVVVRFGSVISNPWTITLKESRVTCANVFLYDELVQYGQRMNCETFELGRSPKNGGSYDFKRRLGAAPRDLYYYRLSESGLSLAPRSRELSWIQAMWKGMPSCASSVLGPTLVKWYI